MLQATQTHLLQRRIHRLAGSLALLAFTAPLTAQGAIPPNYNIGPTSVPATDYIDLAFGNIFGNEEPIVVVVDAGTVELRPDATVIDTTITVPQLTTVTSVAVFKTVEGALEPLFCADSNGLNKVDGTTEWGVGNPTLVLGNILWKNATVMECHEIAGVQYIMGISGDERHVIGSFDLGGGFYTIAIDIPSSRQILDYAVYDHDADGVMEIALLTTNNLRIHEATGSVITTYPSYGGTWGQLAAVKDNDGERLAWATKDSSGDPVLEVLNSAGQETAIALEFLVEDDDLDTLELDIAGMEPGDVQEDGGDDLVLSDKASQRAVVLWNRRPLGSQTQTFLSASYPADYDILHPETADPNASGAANTTRPLVADITSDGTKDVLIALDTVPIVEVYTSLPGAPARPYFSSSVLHLDPTASTLDYNQTDVSVNVALDLPMEIYENYDGVQISLWRQDAENGQIMSTGLTNDIFEFDSADPNQWFDLLVPGQTSNEFLSNQYYLRYRFVDFTETPNLTVTFATPGFVLGLDMGSNQDYMMDLADNLAANMYDIDVQHYEPTNNSGVGSPNTGSYLYTNIDLPSFQNGATPPQVDGPFGLGLWN